MTNNKIRDWFKRGKKEKRYLDDDPPSPEIAAATEEYLLENKELRTVLRALLKKLAPRYKEVLDKRFFEELSVQEISEQIGIPPRRVSERIHYALKCLRKACKEKKISSILKTILLFIG